MSDESASDGWEADESTSWRMRQIGRKDTGPERQVRRVLTDLGFHYRLQNSDLPGSPDLANRSERWAVFVHGCFWHAHEGCSGASIPDRNRERWKEKFQKNRRRDRRVQSELRDRGFTVIVVWECELEDEAEIRERVRSRLEPGESQ